MAPEARTLSLPTSRRTTAVALLRSERVPLVVLGAAMVVAFVVLYRKGFGLTFFYDEWNFVMNRRDWTLDTFLEPHNEHLSLIPVVVFKLLFVTVGLDDYWVYRSAVLALHLVCVALVFVLARRRVDPFLALAAALAILFLGSAWQDLLWPFQIGYLASIAAGLAMLVALEARRDALAAVLAAVALASSSIGLPFAAAALVEVGWRRSDRPRRLWVALAPIALYALWSLAYGNPRAAPGAENGAWPLVTQNIPAAPGYVANAVAGALGAVTGLGLDWGRPLALLAVIVLTIRLVRGPVSTRLASLLLAGLVYWGLSALFRAQLNAPADSRYLYFGGVLVVLVAVEFLVGVRLAVRAGAALAVALAVSIVANFGPLRDGSRGLQDTSAYVAAELGALEVAGPRVDPDYRPDPTRAPDITAGRYFDAVREHGSPADTPREIMARPEPYRQAADAVLVQALAVSAERVGNTPAAGARPFVEAVVGGGAEFRRSCVTFRPAAAGAVLDVRVPRSGLSVTTRGDAGAEVRLRAFAGTYPPTAFASVPGGSTHRMRLPHRPAMPAWHVRLTATEPVTACGLS